VQTYSLHTEATTTTTTTTTTTDIRNLLFRSSVQHGETWGTKYGREAKETSDKSSA